MSVEKLERVMWRLRSRNVGKDVVLIGELERAIMLEIGTDRRTYKENKRALVKLNWVRAEGRCHVRLTGDDL